MLCDFFAADKVTSLEQLGAEVFKYLHMIT